MSPPPAAGGRLPVVREVSAGGVVFRPGAGGHEVCLIATRGGSRWQLPKGLVEEGEEAEAAALREVREETGLEGRVVARLDPIEYWFVWGDADGRRRRHHKRVHWFLVEHTGGDTSDHDREVDEARWFPLEGAMAQVTFRSEREVLAQARERLAGTGRGEGPRGRGAGDG